MWWCLWIVVFLNGSAGDSYVDFTDMGSYRHDSQSNYPSDLTESLKREAEKSLGEASPTAPSTEHSEEKGIVFLKRLVGSLLRQMNVRSHVFGPGEAITLDLQAEIFHEDMAILSDFLNGNNPELYLSSVDRIFSNMIKVVPPPASGTFEFDASQLEVFYSLKFWLLLSTLSIVIFLILTLSLRTVSARTPMHMLFYSFLILFVVSCVWTFADLYEDAKASGFAKIVQAQSVPKDCDFENLGFFHSLSYFFRVTLGGYKDRCEQYYESTMTDPLWNVNPLEAISKSFWVLVVAPLEYVGNKLGLFFKGVIQGVPFWLQPVLIFSLFFFVFFGMFGYTVRTPFMSIEPVARRERPRLEGSGAERSLVRVVTRDVATDTDDLRAPPPGQVPSTHSSSTTRNLIFDFLHHFFHSVISIGDFLLRQCPAGDVTEDEEGNLRQGQEGEEEEARDGLLPEPVLQGEVFVVAGSLRVEQRPFDLYMAQKEEELFQDAEGEVATAAISGDREVEVAAAGPSCGNSTSQEE